MTKFFCDKDNCNLSRLHQRDLRKPEQANNYNVVTTYNPDKIETVF